MGGEPPGRHGLANRPAHGRGHRDALGVGNSPTIAAGQGAVWVANGGDGTLARIDPGTPRVTETIEVGSSPSALAIATGRCGRRHSLRPATGAGLLRLKWPALDPMASTAARTRSPRPQLPELVAGLAAYDGLVAYRRVGGAGGARLVANLASEVPEPSADGRTYVFELRRGIRFSNGAPSARRTRHSLERFLRLDVDAPSSYFDGVLGARRLYGRAPQL